MTHDNRSLHRGNHYWCSQYRSSPQNKEGLDNSCVVLDTDDESVDSSFDLNTSLNSEKDHSVRTG